MNNSQTGSNNELIVYAPIAGKIIPLDQVPDQAFAEGLLGKGVGIDPDLGEVTAPFDGVITALFPTNHALGISADSGLELLIHIGLNTVDLDGQFFRAFVKQGDRVTTGELLVTFDIPSIHQAGYSILSPVVVTNSADYSEVIPTTESLVELGAELLTIKK
ncbi:MAG: PTS glucose transporter subunit IIA [Bifidobacteriaceae bacterium]|jgi:PTS system beta-glucosides-specific IIC component|nr:PTS glucose transporter subunit IIA [Bifidobacteriaceae bacterium]